MEEKYFDRRSEMYSRLAIWVKGGGCLPKSIQLSADLVNPNFNYVQSGKKTKFKLESKADMKKRGVTSPDQGDALALTFAAPVYVSPQPMQLTPASSLSGVPGIGYYKLRGGTEDSWNPFGGD